MALLVERVTQIEPAQQGIGCVLGGSREIAAAVGFGTGEREQLAGSALLVAPHPAVHGAEHAIEPRGL